MAEIGKLYKVELTKAEMYDIGNITQVVHYILYDSASRCAVEITAEVNQAPLLSRVRPYEILDGGSINALEKYLFGNA